MINTNNYKLYIAAFERAISEYLYDNYEIHVDLSNVGTIRLQLLDTPTDEEVSIMEAEMMADFQCDDIKFYLTSDNELLVEIK